MAVQPNFRGTDPADNAAAVTPNDSVDLTNVARALYIGTGGDVKITTAGGDTVTLNDVQGGSILPIRTKRVFSTGTTASNMVAIY
jgi:hypothetical protein